MEKMMSILNQLLETATDQIKKEKILKEKIKINKSKITLPVKKISTLNKIIKNIPNNSISSKNIEYDKLIKKYFKKLIKQKYWLGLENSEDLKKYIDDLTLTEEDIKDLIIKSKEFYQNLSDNEIEDKIINSIDKLNTKENIDKIIFELTESKKIPISFKSYLNSKVKN